MERMFKNQPIGISDNIGNELKEGDVVSMSFIVENSGQILNVIGDIRYIKEKAKFVVVEDDNYELSYIPLDVDIISIYLIKNKE